MNAKFLAGLTAAIATTALFSFSAPVKAQTFNNNNLKFNKNTEVKFTFKSSQGKFKSILSLFEVNDDNTLGNKVQNLLSEKDPGYVSSANDWMGSVKETGPVSFVFKAGKSYTLGLFSELLTDGKWQSKETVYSTNSFNTPVENLAKFTGFVAAPGGTEIRFEDKGLKPYDYNDFVVNAAAVPEPTTMAGLALAGGGLTFVRRRLQGKKA